MQVKDVADVHTGALTRYGAVTENGQGEAVEGIVLTLKAPMHVRLCKVCVNICMTLKKLTPGRYDQAFL